MDPGDRRYDAWLQRTFIDAAKRPGAPAAAPYLRSVAPELVRTLMRETGCGQYLCTHVTETLRRRARELGLVLRGSRRETKARAVRLHERVIADLLYRNRERYVL
jgi:hypothetical protein